MSEQDAAVNKQKLELLQKYNTEANRITQESIETSLLLLMEEKEFSSISITEITSCAGVSRSAYYRSYTSKEDIMTNIFKRAAEVYRSTTPETMSEDMRVSLHMIEGGALMFSEKHDVVAMEKSRDFVNLV